MKYTNQFGCTSEKITERIILEALLSAIQTQAKIAIEVSKYQKDCKDNYQLAISNLNKKVDEIKLSIEKLEVSKIKLYENYKNNVFDKDTYLIERENVDQLIAGKTTTINEMADKKSKLIKKSGADNRFISTFSKYEFVSEVTRELVDELVESINVFEPNRIEITFNFADDYEKVV